MKKSVVLLCGFLACISLTACQGGGAKSKGEEYWSSARKAESFETYVTEHGAEWDLEALKQEASSADSSYSQRFKAAALLCAQEYQSNRPTDSDDSWKDGAFALDYPQSGEYAVNCLSQVTAGGEEFWTSFEDAFTPYDYFWPLLAAADDLDGQALAALWKGIPDETYGYELKDVIEKWVQKKPESIVRVGDALMEAGYYEDWSYTDWLNTYFQNAEDNKAVSTDSVQDVLDYIAYVQKLLPQLEEESGTIKQTSDVSGEEYYNTKMMVAVNSSLDLKEGSQGTAGDGAAEGESAGNEAAENGAAAGEPAEGEGAGNGAAAGEPAEGEGAENAAPGAIEIEGKKVIAFYQNTQAEEFPGSPAPLHVIGDFMFGLPSGEFAASPEEADYYLVLTPNYEYGEYYQINGGSDSKIQEVYSSTSIDLYEASTGNLLRHVGNIQENAPERIFTSYDDETAQYPEVTKADVLSYIYHNINTPDLYVAMLDNIAGKSQLEKEESIIMGKWEITYHGGELSGGFVHGMFQYDPEDGNKFAKGNFTITNKSTEEEGFLPMIYTVGEDTIIELVDVSTGDTYECVDLLSYGKCLNGTYLEPGESKEGEIFFQVPEDVDTANLSFAVSLGRQMVYYPY